jgi:hypothetical protein
LRPLSQLKQAITTNATFGLGRKHVAVHKELTWGRANSATLAGKSAGTSQRNASARLSQAMKVYKT